MNFGDLLKTAMREWTDNDGSQGMTVDYISTEMGVTVEAVKAWRANKNGCKDVEKLANILFGNKHSELRDQLVRECKIHNNKKNTLEYYSKISTVRGFWEKAFIELDNKLRAEDYSLDASSINDAAWQLMQIDRTLDDKTALRIAEAARKYIYDIKYGKYADINEDERHVTGIDKWNREFTDILSKYRINSDESDLLVAGIGPGFEGVGIYDGFKSFTGLDISPEAVKKARVVFGKAYERNIISVNAERLPEVALNKDLYISLKTYQSSYFDINKAVIECSRCLKKDGKAIISIPRGYYKNDKKEFGLSRTVYEYQSSRVIGTYRLPDKGYVYDLIKQISKELNKRMFSNICIETGEHEFYIIATKT